MRLTSKVIGAAAIAIAIALTMSAADANSRHIRYDGAYAYAPSHGRDFVYGANRAPYGHGFTQDNPRDFQLQGTH